jgi:hypothetical protein
MSFRYRRLSSTIPLRIRDRCYKVPEWPAEIERAQTLTHHPIGGELLISSDQMWRADPTPCHDSCVTKG